MVVCHGQLCSLSMVLQMISSPRFKIRNPMHRRMESQQSQASAFLTVPIAVLTGDVDSSRKKNRYPFPSTTLR